MTQIGLQNGSPRFLLLLLNLNAAYVESKVPGSTWEFTLVTSPITAKTPAEEFYFNVDIQSVKRPILELLLFFTFLLAKYCSWGGGGGG